MSRHNRARRRESYNIPGHAHELTFSCYQRFPFLKAERCCNWLAEAINSARETQGFLVWAYVFMPDHVHLISYPTREKYDMGQILKAIKQPVGERAIAFLQANSPQWLGRVTRQRGRRTERLFWQSGGGYDRNITAPRTLLKMIDYTHENPMRKQLVATPSNWVWSSAAHYEGGSSRISVDPIPPEWLDMEA